MDILKRLDTWFRAEMVYFRRIPFVRRALRGTLTKESYIAFLREYYHFVRSASPAYSLAVAHVPPKYDRIRDWLFKTAFAQSNTADLILDDLKALGIKKSLVLKTMPSPQTDALIGYNYYFPLHHHPVGIMGTPYLMTRLSTGFSLIVARNLQERFELGAHQGTSFFLSVGHLDDDQPEAVNAMIEDIKDDEIENQVLFNAQAVFALYKSFFWSFGDPDWKNHREEARPPARVC